MTGLDLTTAPVVGPVVPAMPAMAGMPVVPVAPATPTVLVTVGTDHHEFDRVLAWVDAWVDALEGARPRLVVQHGTTAGARHGENRAFLDHDELQVEMAAAVAVVTHGGPATIFEARRHGHVPLCVPRDPLLGEHVDGHQQLFARRLGASGLVTLCEDAETLGLALTAQVRAGSLARLPGAGSAAGEAALAGLVADLIGRPETRRPRRERWTRRSGRSAVRA